MQLPQRTSASLQFACVGPITEHVIVPVTAGMSSNVKSGWLLKDWIFSVTTGFRI